MKVVGAVIVENNKIKLFKRSLSLSKFPGFYEFPGGKVEKDETLKIALKRELDEELSISVNESDILEFDKNNLDTEKINLTLFIINKWKKNIILNPNIHSEMIEVEINQIKNIKELLELDKNLVTHIITALIP